MDLLFEGNKIKKLISIQLFPVKQHWQFPDTY